MVKFSNRKKVDAKSVSDIREMPMVVVQRWRHPVVSLLFPVEYSLYIVFVSITMFYKKFNFKNE
jgi:hypothetical protein